MIAIGPAGSMQAPLASRGLRPIGDLAEGRPHGDRLRYMAGCRCFHCRRANSAYEAARKIARAAGDWNGIVLAAKARAHLAELAAKGVGRRAAGDACDVSDTTLSAIIGFRKLSIRARTERAILSVTADAAADRALIPAGPTWKLLDDLIADGYSKAELARALGYKRPALQLNRDKVTVRNAHDVQRLYLRLCMVDAAPTLRRLNALAYEGYTRRMIRDRLGVLAARHGEPGPVDLTVHRGRVRAHTERYVLALYRQLIE